MESEGKTVKSGGGFGGTGFKFDEAEAQYTTEKKKFQKAALGLQVIDDGGVGYTVLTLRFYPRTRMMRT